MKSAKITNVDGSSQDNSHRCFTLISDWKINYAVNHGVDHFMFCWFRGGVSNINNTIKNSPYSFAINKSFLRSKYINDCKFTIQWITGNYFAASNATDMSTYLIPYWIEHYFKHPSYLKTSDNKPILGIYQIAYLETELGSAAAVASLLNDMRAQCLAEGFGGLAILAEYRGTDQNFIDKLASYGIDYIYQYAYHPFYDASETQAIDFQRSTLNTQRTYAAGRMGIVPAVGMGWDNSALQYPGPPVGGTYRLSASSFKNQCLWVKNTFGAPVIDPAGNHLVLIDNMDEYVEGHYIMPASGTTSLYPNSSLGFGYLDAIMESFSSTTVDENRNIISVDHYIEWLYPKRW